MNGDLISRSALLEAWKTIPNDYDDPTTWVDAMAKVLEAMPAVETEPNRVLTWDEFIHCYNGFVWVENYHEPDGYMPGYLDGETIYLEGEIEARSNFDTDNAKKHYGKRGYARCWLRKPTDEEWKAVPWNE